MVFLDEMGASTNMTRHFRRARRGERAGEAVPNGNGSTATLIAAVALQGAHALMVVDGPTDTEVFAASIRHFLAPELKPGTIAVMDNLSAHKSPRVAGPI